MLKNRSLEIVFLLQEHPLKSPVYFHGFMQMSNNKFLIVKYNDSNDCKVLEVCHSYQDADDKILKWDNKFPESFIDILAPGQYNNLQIKQTTKV